MPHGYLAYLLPVLVLAMVLRRSLRSQRLKVDRLWVIPVLLVIAAVSVLSQAPPTDPAMIAVLAVVTLAGAGIGWQRGRLTRINLDPDTGILTSKASPAAVVLILAIFGLRYGLNAWLAENPYKGALAVEVADALLLFGVGVLGVARIEMWLRCKRLIAGGAGIA
jgi:hypothetical protein